MKKYRLLTLLAPFLLFAACQMGAPEGLRLTPPGEGPAVVHDINHKPLPEIPFPNDIATRADASALTGRRINASMIAPTGLERSVRKKLDRLDGFGTLQPITVSFDAPLDIDELLARQRDNLDFADDAVYLIDISPDSPTYAQPVLLDIGRGNYPLTLKRSGRYFPSDPRAAATNLLFDTIDEDLNGNGLLDPGEDTDDDGVLDRPNVWPPGADPKDGLMTFYESETDTLILRPVVPLREQTTYAVVLTDRLLGRHGQPVRSPFEWIHHLNQAHDLNRLHDVFAIWRSKGLELSVDQLAFAWSFSTQSVTAELVAVREGYNGVGPLAWLADEFSVHVTPLKSKSPDQPPPYYLIEAESLMNVFEKVGPSILGDNMNIAGPILDSFGHVEYFASGSFASADFMRTGPNGLDPANMHSENFDLDLKAGTAAHSRNKLRFVLAVPKITAEHQPPFPVAIYCHSYSSLRAEALAFAGYLAKQGIASVGIDAWGHGIPADDDLADIIITTGGAFGFEPFAAELLEDRARDVNGDGSNDSGADYWTAYGFHTRDVVRQTVADHFQLVRVLKSFDGKRTWDLDQNGDGELDLAGDFNGDGLVDLGGAEVPYFAWGQSGGGITSAVLSPLEPAIIAAAPTAGGGGMSDVGLRTMLGNVRNAVMLRTMGPLVVGERTGNDTLRVSILASLGTDTPTLPIATVEGLRPGDRVTVTNLDKDEAHMVHVREGPRFRVSMEADAGDHFEVAFHDPDGQLIARLSTWQEDVFFYRNDLVTFAAGDALRSPAEGFGLARCTPSLRRMVGLLQMILEPADPANMASHYFLDPLDIRPEGRVVTNLLELACLGDQDVPVQTQATLGRAAGLIPYLEVDPRYGITPNDWLIENYVYEGLPYIGRFPGSDAVFDPDNLDEGNDGFDVPQPEPGDELRSVIETDTGVSGIRFAYLLPGGQHGIFPTGVENDFDVFTFFVSQVAHFFASRGTEIKDDPCLATASCE
jgi:hypothetical protein